ncbi:helix-turn-helix transcriptional regulator [Leucobacter sp. CSA1]|uniref:Helix-turn-helix transcriptional regulator n=1 Tax=Leucobacter chromiisoli TaxID=2796471 RepID=A0A934UW48_9MICO|nr:helix-turn-helix transcriptional regulator [Leucobacter chromiisoli]
MIKTERLSRGLTQQEVAGAVGITRQSLARIEKGHGGASLDTFLRIFSALGITLSATSGEQEENRAQNRTLPLGGGAALSSLLGSKTGSPYADIFKRAGGTASASALKQLPGAGTDSVLNALKPLSNTSFLGSLGSDSARSPIGAGLATRIPSMRLPRLSYRELLGIPVHEQGTEDEPESPGDEISPTGADDDADPRMTRGPENDSDA